jgi:shikimate dehydrogenase
MRFAVLGSPIGHSKSPALHTAAFAALGLDWGYEAIEVESEGLEEFIRSRDEEWLGFSLTMPLKRTVLPLLDRTDELVHLTGGANTVVFDSAGGRRTLDGFNTDVYGINQALRNAGVTRLRSVRLLGGGATAASAIVAATQLGATRFVVALRSPRKASDLLDLGDSLGVDIQLASFGAIDDGVIPDAVISTIPGGAEIELSFNEATRRNAILFDVAYEPWPTPLAAAWLEVGGRVVPGIEMLVNQALLQVRIFIGGDPARAVPGEARVLAAMRAAVGLK